MIALGEETKEPNLHSDSIFSINVAITPSDDTLELVVNLQVVDCEHYFITCVAPHEKDEVVRFSGSYPLPHVGDNLLVEEVSVVLGLHAADSLCAIQKGI